MSKDSNITGQEVAIIGMAGRFPGAGSIEQFWHNLSEGNHAISYLTDDELRAKGVDESLISDKTYVKLKGGVLEGWDLFDAAFFGYTPTEAELMDPQIRVFHECAWHALENAGYDSQTYDGLIGMYAGASTHLNWAYLSLMSQKSREIGIESALYLTDKDYLSSRVSYKLNLRGPSIVTQTACSTSLVTVHLACQALLDGECDMALAGGVSIETQEKTGYLAQEGAYLSSDGRIRAFDEGASGSVPGNGVGIVVLKLLEDALNDGDNIYAIIKGSAVNNDGADKANFNAPGVDGQKRVIRLAQAVAEVEPESISYIEAHGTGTLIGDPIEIEALKQAFDTDKKGFCAISAVKSSIGHLNAAAGVAGLITAALALKNGAIPPSLNFNKPNPMIDFANSPFYVNTKLKKWENETYPLRAGVSSFGLGGTNAHIILQESPEIDVSSGSRKYQMLALSAKTQHALDKMTENLGNYINKNKEMVLADIAYTLQAGRSSLPYKKFIVCSNMDEAATDLLDPENEKIQTGFSDDIDRPIIFMFSGQGSQYVNMGLDLYETEAIFQKEVDLCFDILEPIMGENIKEILYPTNNIEKTKEKIQDIIYSGPVKFVFEYCLSQMLIRWGLKPYAMIGHSLGEYTAACIAGVFSLKDALTLVAIRNRLVKPLPKGAMVSVDLPEKELSSFIDDNLSIAAINTPYSTIVSGAEDNISKFITQVSEKGYDCIRLKVDRAGHSMMLDPILNEFEAYVRQVKLNKPRIPYISNVSGTWITTNQATDPVYWVQHLRRTVRFSDGLCELLKTDNALFVQIGPDRGIASFVQQQQNYFDNNLAINLVRHPKEDISDTLYLIDKIGLLWLSGIKIDWEAFYSEEKRNRLPLPAYPFEGVSFRIDRNETVHDIDDLTRPLEKPEKQLTDLFYLPSWKRTSQKGTNSEKMLNENWIVFADNFDIGNMLSKKLKNNGVNIIFVQGGMEFHTPNEYEYTLNPEHKDSYDRLFSDLNKKKIRITAIVHLWSLYENVEQKLKIDHIDHDLNMGFYSLLFIAQSLGDYPIYDELHIDVITNNMQEVTGGDLLFPEKATVLGPVKIIEAEYERITCRSIDIDLPNIAQNTNGNIVDQLMKELVGNHDDKIVAWRGNYRWTQSFDPYLLERNNAGKPFPLKEKGVYLIIGGLGRVGLILAEHLGKTVQARLVLTQRTRFPARSKWDNWLEDHNADDEISQKITKLIELEAHGAQILIISADVANIEQVQATVNQSIERFGAINGVIHCAMVGAGLMIQRRTREDIENEFASKVKGTFVLDRALKNAKLDFLVFCSSISSALPIIGQVGYCASNAFIDAFAHYKTAHSDTRAISINWNLWEDTPLVGPMGDVMNIHKNCLKTSKGIDAFNRILACEEPQVLISTEDINTMIYQFNRYGLTHLKEASKIVTHAGLMPAQVRASVAYEKPSNPTEGKLADIWQRFFGYEQIGTHDNFFNLGGDSLKALQIISLIREEMDFRVPIATFFRLPTIQQLSTFIISGHQHTYETLHNLHDPEGEKAISLVCVPYAAGSTSTYMRLANEVSKINNEIAIYAIEIPGNDFGCSHIGKKDVEEIAKEVVDEIKRDLTSPIALYGHCVGSFIALEICRLLENESIDVKFVGIGGIVVTLADGNLDPNMLYNHSEEEMQQVFMELGAFKDQIGNIADEEFNFISNNLKEDVRVVFEHLSRLSGAEDANKINAPIYNIVSDTDLTTQGYQTLYKNWYKFSNKVDMIEIKGGGHYFIDEKVHETAGIIAKLITKEL